MPCEMLSRILAKPTVTVSPHAGGEGADEACFRSAIAPVLFGLKSAYTFSPVRKYSRNPTETLQFMYIGALSKLTGASRKAIHHYEALGLIPVPPRKGRYRTYSDEDAVLICTIKRAQSLGFTLREIAGVVSTRAKTKRLPLEMVSELVERKRKELREHIDRAISQDRLLAELQADLRERAASASASPRSA